MTITEKKNYIVDWIRQYFAINGPNSKAVVGISGGKDSTIAAALCVEALGKDRVLGVLMPEGEQVDIVDSYRVCEWLDIPYIEINIDSACYGIYKEMAHQNLNINKVVYTNLPARIRMTTLYAVAASVGGRVCNTSNASEIYVGYSTKWGDGVGDFGPLRKLTVQGVIEIGRELGLPEDLILKPPADGLSGQTDEENMGLRYSDIDKVVLGETWDLDEGVYLNIITRNTQARHKTIDIPSPSKV